MKRFLTLAAMFLLLIGTMPVTHAQESIPEVSTLSELQDAIAQAEEGDTIKVKNTMLISDSITIGEANKQVKLMFYGEGVMFHIFEQSDPLAVYLQNLDIEHAERGNNCAVLAGSSGTLFINNCHIENYHGDFGGAVKVDKGHLSVFQSEITNCSAMSLGGAIYVSADATCEISQSRFTGNYSFSDGGAVHSYGDIEIYDSTFDENSSWSNGGAICGNNVRIIRSTVINNSSLSGSGGGIYTNSNLTTQNCVIYENSASVSANDLSVRGTATLYVDDGTSLYGDILTENGCDSWAWYTDQNGNRYSADTPTTIVEDTRNIEGSELTFAVYNASDPEPTPDPLPNPEPLEPEPMPEPAPIPEPEEPEEPAPEPTPDPEPVEPEPTPTPEPEPSPEPEPELTPTPVDPQPTPTPEPEKIYIPTYIYIKDHNENVKQIELEPQKSEYLALSCGVAELDGKNVVVFIDDVKRFTPAQERLTRGKAAAVIYGLLSEESQTACDSAAVNPYTDLSNSPYQKAVSALTGARVFCGQADSSFLPDSIMTYGQLLTVLTRFVEPKEGYIGSFNVLDHWAAPAAVTAASYGWIEDVPIDLNAPATYGAFVNLLIKIYDL